MQRDDVKEEEEDEAQRAKTSGGGDGEGRRKWQKAICFFDVEARCFLHSYSFPCN